MCDNVHPPKIVAKHFNIRASKPIPIGMHHTVCGSEALNLAKRLSEELANQQAVQGGSLGIQSTQHKTPDEPRSRSFEQGEKSKGNSLTFENEFYRIHCVTNRHQQQLMNQTIIAEAIEFNLYLR